MSNAPTTKAEAVAAKLHTAQVEAMAMAICFAGFSVWAPCRSAVHYWRTKVDDDARQHYRREAEVILDLVRRYPVSLARPAHG